MPDLQPSEDNALTDFDNARAKTFSRVGDEPGRTICPEDIPEGRTANIAQLDLSDLSDSASPEAVEKPVHTFAKAVTAAARMNRKALAAAESRVAANTIEAKLGQDGNSLLADAASKNPRLVGYGIKIYAKTYRKAPAGFYKEPAKIVQSWLELPDKLHNRKGKEIIARLRDRYPDYPIPNDYMSRRLHWRQRKHLQKLMATYGIETQPLDCQSLSAIKKRIKLHLDPPEYEVFKPVIMIAKDQSHVIWDDKQYTVFLNGSTPTIKRKGKRTALAAIMRLVGE